jgi:hypothetical protein
MAQEMVKKVDTAKTMMSRGTNYALKQSRLDKDEEELKVLMSKHKGDEVEETTDEEENTNDVEETTEESEVEEKQTESEEEEESDEGLSREEKSFKKRYGDLRRHMAEKEKEWKESLEDHNNTASLRAPTSDEDIEAWAEKYPDVAAIVETIASKKADEKFAVAEERLREFDEAAYEAERTKAEITIRKSHADFDELRDSDKFHDWVESQPKWVRDALYENSDDAASVVRVIDLYKVDNGMTIAAKKKASKDAAKTVSKRSTPAVDSEGSASMIKESEVAKMSDRDFEENYDKIQKAMSSGKFIYDVSGKAR